MIRKNDILKILTVSFIGSSLSGDVLDHTLVVIILKGYYNKGARCSVEDLGTKEDLFGNMKILEVLL